MHDIRWIRDNPDGFDDALKKRGIKPYAEHVIIIDKNIRTLTTQIQKAQSRRNEASKQIGKAKSKNEDANELIAEVAELRGQIQSQEKAEQKLHSQLKEILQQLPNLPDLDVPFGKDETSSIEIRRYGEFPTFKFDPKQHFEIGEYLGEMDFEKASLVSGARFVVLSGRLARLERALAAFMLDILVSHFGYLEVSPPLLVTEQSAFGAGNLPKFEEDLFKTTDGYYLIPTAEMVLTNLVRHQVLEEEELPLRYVSATPCFRSEAGAAGRDTRGMIRQHQFNKVEMVSISLPERSGEEHERMTSCAEDILKRLNLHYRVMLLSSGDMGFSAKKTYDLEVWLPGQNTFREISSCSNCGDFQAQRMNARFKRVGRKGTEFIHSLNGSGLAVGRTLIAVIENYQNSDGSISVPTPLQPYMSGAKVII